MLIPGPIGSVLRFALFLFFIVLIGRLVLEWVQVFARTWRPTGVALVVAEATYTVTDPPLRLLRRFLPPLRLGPVQLDLAFTVLGGIAAIAFATYYAPCWPRAHGTSIWSLLVLGAGYGLWTLGADFPRWFVIGLLVTLRCLG